MEEKIQRIKDHIKKVYLSYNRPFVIGFSGGKDSSATAQLIWEALTELNIEELKNDIYILSSDTLVETPFIIKYLNHSLEQINITAEKLKFPIKAIKVSPKPEKSFWVNLIGKGYPAPTQMFRWCTQRLKIDPINEFILNLANNFGEVTVVLGARKEESASRSQVLSKKTRDKLGLSKHTSLPAAFVFTPIENLTTDEVWLYLLKNPKTPWNTTNRDLSAMYLSASDGECPTVIDKSTSSCGQSRFGCWVCTLVQKDTSMENLIDNGEDWMLPLLELRNLLNETATPDKKHIYRNLKGRDGKVRKIRDTEVYARRSLKFKWKKKILRKLLQAQVDIQNDGPDPKTILISEDELKLIRKIWKEENNDWLDTVPKIYKEITKQDLNIKIDDGISFNNEDYDLLSKLCKEENIAVELVSKLIDEERKMDGMSKRGGIIQKIEKILSEEWRSEEEILIRN